MRSLMTLAFAATLLAACGKQEPAAPAAPGNPPQTSSSTSAQPAAPAPEASAAAVASAGNEKGEHVYKATCSMCHATGAGGAPTFKSKEEWGPRIAQGKDKLYAHALQGFTGAKGTMPPKGGNPSLADDEVKAAVDYMAAAAQ